MGQRQSKHVQPFSHFFFSSLKRILLYLLNSFKIWINDKKRGFLIFVEDFSILGRAVRIRFQISLKRLFRIRIEWMWIRIFALNFLRYFPKVELQLWYLHIRDNAYAVFSAPFVQFACNLHTINSRGWLAVLHHLQCCGQRSGSGLLFLRKDTIFSHPEIGAAVRIHI
jgi:hypothetical protein